MRLGIVFIYDPGAGDVVDDVLSVFDGRRRPIAEAQVDAARADLFDGETVADALARREGVAVLRDGGTWYAANSSSPLWASADTTAALLPPAAGGAFRPVARCREVDARLVSRLPVSAVVEAWQGKTLGPEVAYDAAWRDVDGDAADALYDTLRDNPDAMVAVFAYEDAPEWRSLYE